MNLYAENDGISPSRRGRGPGGDRRSDRDCVPTAALAALAGSTPPGRGTDPSSAESVQRAEQVLAGARKALGGDKLAKLETPRRVRPDPARARGTTWYPIGFEGPWNRTARQ